MPKKPRVCGRLVTNRSDRVDVCGQEAGHDESLTPTPHRGQYRDMVWTDIINKRTGKRGYNIISQGNAFDHERLEGGKPVTEIRRHTIDPPAPAPRQRKPKAGGHVPPPPIVKGRRITP